MGRKFILSVGEIYHVYNKRGDSNLLFLDIEDKNRFLKLLFLCNGTAPVDFRELPEGETFGEMERGEALVDIGAYVLMPTHFHLLIKEKQEGGISKFMSKLSTAYSMYFNKKYERIGCLFVGSFKAKHADKDEYLKYLFAYIHLNPIKIIDPLWKQNGINDFDGAKGFLETYRYSSYYDYTGLERQESLILNKFAFPDYFENLNNFKIFINEWLLSKPEGETFGREGEGSYPHG